MIDDYGCYVTLFFIMDLKTGELVLHIAGFYTFEVRKFTVG
mgnify:CR=1 FL=1|tara:strand:- start:222 stop:344 length:123 start_codon:yes stop_codon:yes gene_type:complete